MILTVSDMAERLRLAQHYVHHLLERGYVQASGRTRRGDYLFLESDIEAVRAAMQAHPPRPRRA